MINISFQRGSEVRSLTRSKEYVSGSINYQIKTPLNGVKTSGTLHKTRTSSCLHRQESVFIK